MALIPWNDSYSVNVSRFDEEHKKLIGLINNFHEAMSQGRGNDVIGKVLDSLVAYTKTHFAHEESLMTLHNYPGYEDQKKQHETFVKKLEEYQSLLSKGE